MLNTRVVSPHHQRGVFLIEALIGIVLFAIGILALISMQASTVSVQSDAQFRIEAANLVDRMVAELAVGVDRTSPATIQSTLSNYAYNATTVTPPCTFSGGGVGGAPTTTANAVNAWVTAVTTALPGSTTTMQQILVDTTTFNKVTITVCWKTADDAIARQHSVITYVN